MTAARATINSVRSKTIVQAQDDANRLGKVMAVLNLNTVGAAMYVIREYDESMETGRFAHQFVAKMEPLT
jgi:hypothetical protein